MATPSAPRTRTRSKPARKVHFNALVGAIYLTIGQQEFAYWLDLLPHDLGAEVRCYRLTKFVATRKEGEPDHYDVTLRPHAGSGECECKGHLRWSHRGTVCKHIACLLSLHQAGRLS